MESEQDIENELRALLARLNPPTHAELAPGTCLLYPNPSGEENHLTGKVLFSVIGIDGELISPGFVVCLRAGSNAIVDFVDTVWDFVPFGKVIV